VVVAGLLSPGSVVGQPRIVINEIHYNPDVKTEPVEFIELYNAGSSPVNLGGWSFSGGLDYTFPSTNIAPGGFVVVAQNPAALRAKFGVQGALGPFNPDGSSALNKFGETIVLRDASGQTVDEVDYKLGFPWPTVGDPPGYSIELINPNLDNSLGGHWRASVGSGSPARTNTLVAAQSVWRYRKGTNEASSPTTAWRQVGFDDSAWAEGTLPLGYGETFIATPLNDMQNGYVSVFLRKKFVVTDPAQFSRLVLEAQYDDGFKAWINGVLVIDGNANMPAGEVAYNTPAVSAIENLNFVTFNLAVAPSSLLVPGTNVIAVQAANASLGASSDFFFDARLLGISGGGAAGPTPGRINSVYATNAPPAIRQVTHTPEQPRTGQPVRISAKVTDPDGVANVTLEYQVVLPGQYIELTDPAYTNAANWIALPMRDDGTEGDWRAGDDIYSAEIPAQVQVHRRLVRYRITVRDTLGAAVRVPYADDPQPNFAYFVYDGVPAWTGAQQPGASGSNGVVFTVSSNEMGRLPVLFLIGKSNTIAQATWFSRYTGDGYLWLGTLVYDGKVYDHIRYRARGGVWRYSMVKNMWKFDMNRGHDFQARDNWGRPFKVPWRKVNLGACIQQGDFDHRGEQGMFESVGSRLFELAGVPSFKTAFVTLRVIDDALEASPTSQYEGDFWGLYLFVEQEDGRFLEEHSLPDSNLYKMEGGTGELNNLGPNGPTDKSDLNYILQNYTGASEAWWRTNWNLAKYYSYQTIVQAIHHYDINADKNFFYYYHPATRLWEVIPWDLDLTWAHNMYNSSWGGLNALASRILGATAEAGTGAQAGTHNLKLTGARPAFELEFRNRVREIRDLLFNTNETFRLIDEYSLLLRGPPGTNRTILDADRAQWDYNPKMIDSAYTPNLNKAGQGRFYAFPRESSTNASLRGSFEATIQIMKHYVRIRSEHLDALAADPAIPARPTLVYTGPSGYPANRLSFRVSPYSGTHPFAAMRWRVGEISDPTVPGYRPGDPWKYEIEPVWESGLLSPWTPDFTLPAGAVRVGSTYRVRVQFIDSTGRQSHWSEPVQVTVGEPEAALDLQAYLRITELMYNPPPGGYEFIELYNASPTVALDLSGVKFTRGIDFTFPQGTVLLPGAYLLLANTADLAAFRAYYGLDDTVLVLGPYSGALDNAGEQLTLRTGAGGSDIVSFQYNDGRGWPQAADGAGHSLVLIETALSTQAAGSGEYGGNWRPSTYLRGSPGRSDPTPPPGPVLNEVAANTHYADPAHPEFDSNDWIELFNPTDTDLVLGPGWYLSDDGRQLTKWQIPPGTVIPARGFVTFDEVTGFHNPTNTGFGLSKSGEQVFLSYLPGTGEDRVVDAVTFKGQEAGWSYGRYPDGAPYWQALDQPTRGGPNAAPGPHVVINELHYHPPDVGGTNDNTLEEFIEIWNPTSSPVPLFDAAGAWRLDGAVNLTLPGQITLAPGGYLLVVSFDPVASPDQLAAFRSMYGLTNEAVPIVGPYEGKLPNSSGRVALERPLAADQPGEAGGWVIVDEVIYVDQSPWPCGTDGTGASLQRQSVLGWGNDPLQWAGGTPTPGGANVVSPPGAPVITAPPSDRIVGTNAPVSFSVVVCGPPPFFYQWQFNGTNLPGATNPVLTLASATLADAGFYTVVVSNAAGAVVSPPAWLIVQYPPIIVRSPENLTRVQYETAVFTVTAEGTPPLFYQWRFNGQTLSGATNASLVLTNVEPEQGGTYSVVVWNAAASTSASATLTVRPLPVITQQPVGGTVGAGSNFTLRVTATGTGPVSYQWQFQPVGGTEFGNLSGATAATLVLSNVQLAASGLYRVLVTDTVGTRVSAEAEVIVLEKPTITLQPQSQTVAVGQAVSFSVEAVGTAPLWYRWRKNSATYAWPAPARLLLAEVTLADAGTYDVVVTNLANAMLGGFARSSNAYLTAVQPPTNQTVLPGAQVTFRAIVSMPRSVTNGFVWLFNGQPLILGTNAASSSLTLFTNDLVLTNVSTAQAGLYTFMITSGPCQPAAFSAWLRVEGPDRDGDGLPDDWELAHGLDPSDPSDRRGDPDGDGMDNRAEYLAGTDPHDAASCLRLVVTHLPANSPGGVCLEFLAISNRVYRVIYTDSLPGYDWTELARVWAGPTSSWVRLTNWPAPNLPQRFYRVSLSE